MYILYIDVLAMFACFIVVFILETSGGKYGNIYR